MVEKIIIIGLTSCKRTSQTITLCKWKAIPFHFIDSAVPIWQDKYNWYSTPIVLLERWTNDKKPFLIGGQYEFDQYLSGSNDYLRHARHKRSRSVV